MTKNMIKIISLKEQQGIILDILNYTVDICEKNELRYFLAGGTLLGAIRHSGFIPWDNDIDISMPREDYDKLVNIIKVDDSIYKVLIFDGTNNYYDAPMKVVDSRTYLVEKYRSDKVDELGLYIDIFPLDGYGDDKQIARKKLKHLSKLANRALLCNNSLKHLSLLNKVKRLILRLYFVLFDRVSFFNNIEDSLRECKFDASEYIGSTYGSKIEDEIIEREYFSDCVEVTFENRKYKAPIGWDSYLKQMYGDYMKLPPISERIQPHDIEAYWR